MSDSSKVTAGKPKVGGACFVDATSATLPTTADATLAATFTGLGYFSDDGLTNENSAEFEEVVAWGGDTVLTPQKSKSDKFKFMLIEALNVEVLKEVYGSDNVTGTLATGVTVKANSSERDYRAWVFDMVMTGGVLKRTTIPKGKITELGEITYNDTDPVGYEVTLSCAPDATGQTHYEYLKAPAVTP